MASTEPTSAATISGVTPSGPSASGLAPPSRSAFICRRSLARMVEYSLSCDSSAPATMQATPSAAHTPTILVHMGCLPGCSGYDAMIQRIWGGVTIRKGRPPPLLARGDAARAVKMRHPPVVPLTIFRKHARENFGSRSCGRDSSSDAGLARGRYSSGFFDGSGILETCYGFFRAGRQLRFRDVHVERRNLSGHPSRTAAARPARRRLPWRRAGTELHLHLGTSSEDGVYHRHPSREHGADADVQGAV